MFLFVVDRNACMLVFVGCMPTCVCKVCLWGGRAGGGWEGAEKAAVGLRCRAACRKTCVRLNRTNSISLHQAPAPHTRPAGLHFMCLACWISLERLGCWLML